MNQAISQVDILMGLDRLAKRFVAMNPSLDFRIASTPAELEATYRLRYEEVIARGWASPADLPEGLERDEYDAAATHITAWKGSTLVAITRLVFPSPNRLLPTEAAFDVKIEPRSQVVDVGRTVVAPQFRDRYQHKVLLGLLGRCWLEIRAQGCSGMCFIFSEPIRQLYDGLGFEIVVLGPARNHYGEMRFPCRLDLEKTLRRVKVE
jgi:hypothetical protein